MHMYAATLRQTSAAWQAACPLVWINPTRRAKDAPVEGWIMPGLRRGPGLGRDSDRSAINRDNYFRSRFGRTISFTDVSGPADTRYGSRRGHAGSGEAGRSCQYWMTMITVCGRSRIRSD
jgi:hypothetical protein